MKSCVHVCACVALSLGYVYMCEIGLIVAKNRVGVVFGLFVCVVEGNEHEQFLQLYFV